MKQLIAMVIAVTMLASSTFAYTPTSQDEQLLDTLEKRVEVIKDKHEDKIEKVLVRLDFILQKVKEDSRAHYVLGNLYDMLLDSIGATDESVDELALELLNVGRSKDHRSKSKEMKEFAKEKRANAQNKDDDDE